MHWTFEAIKYLEEAQWPTTRRDLIEYLTSCTDAPDELITALEELDVEDDQEFSRIDEMWVDVPKISDYEHYFTEEE